MCLCLHLGSPLSTLTVQYGKIMYAISYSYPFSGLPLTSSCQTRCPAQTAWQDFQDPSLPGNRYATNPVKSSSPNHNPIQSHSASSPSPSSLEPFVPTPVPFYNDLRACRTFVVQCLIVFKQQSLTYASESEMACLRFGLAWDLEVWEKEFLFFLFHVHWWD